MSRASRIVIADDHPIFRQGLRQVIEKDEELSVVGEAEDGEAALAQIDALQPDIVILDIDMPKLDGFQVVKKIHEKAISVKIIFLTMHKGEDMFNEALDLGVPGYVLKESAVVDIIQSIKGVVGGRNFISPQLMEYLLNRRNRADSLLKRKPSLHSLTPTEKKILLLISEHKTSREIAGELFISIRTVENHRNNICQKLELKGSHSLIKFALDNKSELRG
jgi:DNA-binding NarL/FixJ family response regulator